MNVPFKSASRPIPKPKFEPFRLIDGFIAELDRGQQFIAARDEPFWIGKLRKFARAQLLRELPDFRVTFIGDQKFRAALDVQAFAVARDAAREFDFVIRLRVPERPVQFLEIADAGSFPEGFVAQSKVGKMPAFNSDFLIGAHSPPTSNQNSFVLVS
jgi:hypothetical protein